MKKCETNQLLERIERHNQPWVLYLSITYRPRWFSYWWKTRGANFLHAQVWKFSVTVGMPWNDDYLVQHHRDYGTLDHIKKTNTANLRHRFSVLIGRYL